MKIGSISNVVNKGKHVTSHRELVALPSGAIMIDNPVMREVGITDTSGALDSTFDQISNLAGQCRFNNCTHTSEVG